MRTFKIRCNYELTPLLRNLLGAKLSGISGKDCTISIGENLTCFGWGIMRLSAYHEIGGELLSIEFVSKGQESYAGDLYSIEAIKIEKGNRKKFSEQEIYPTKIISEFGRVKKIVGLGEVKNEIVYVKGKEEEVSCFFPPDTILPEVIDINTKTLEVIGFLFETGKWLYLYSHGEGNYGIDFQSTSLPDEISKSDGYLEMGKKIEILEVFESD